MDEVEADPRKTGEALEGNFLAFDAGTLNEQTCASRIETLTQRLADQRCERVRPQNAIDLDDPPPTIDEVKGYLAEVIEMITSGTREDQEAVTPVLVGPTIVKGRRSIRPSFILPTQKVRVPSRVVHPDIHNKNLAAEIEGPRIELSEVHSKVRRAGYRGSRLQMS